MRSPAGAGSKRLSAKPSASAVPDSANDKSALAPQRHVFNRVDRICFPFKPHAERSRNDGERTREPSSHSFTATGEFTIGQSGESVSLHPCLWMWLEWPHWCTRRATATGGDELSPRAKAGATAACGFASVGLELERRACR